MGSSVVRSTLVSSVSTLAPSSTLAHRPSQSIKSQSATGTALSEPLLLEKARTPLLPASTPSGFELSRLMQHEFASSANGNCALFERSPAPLSFQIANLFLLRTSAVTISIGNQPATFASTFQLMI